MSIHVGLPQPAIAQRLAAAAGARIILLNMCIYLKQNREINKKKTIRSRAEPEKKCERSANYQTEYFLRELENLCIYEN